MKIPGHAVQQGVAKRVRCCRQEPAHLPGAMLRADAEMMKIALNAQTGFLRSAEKRDTAGIA